MTPEAQARQDIDARLVAAGWLVQDYKKLNLGAGLGIAVREVPLKTGPCDYLLFVDRKPVGVIEAKKAGVTLSVVAEQAANYAANLPDILASLAPAALPFLYQSTGVETYFRDERDPDARSRRLFAFHRPETLAGWLAEADTLRARLRTLTFGSAALARGALRDCQFEAITNLEQSFAQNRPRALVQMATGSGKTYTACAFAYRLIRHAKARRILFLVDRANLGRQALAEFQQFVDPDTGRKFTELYIVQHLTSNRVDPTAKVVICTIQRLYSMLRGEELPEDADELSVAALDTPGERPREVAYAADFPPEFFDFIVTDECHRSIYGLWRQVLEYFDAFLVGLTATPGAHTIGFFDKNLVMEYGHERAVTDGVNVGYDVYRIRTAITEKGVTIEKHRLVDKRHRATRAVRWEQTDDDLVFAPADLDRSVVVKDQIRTVLRAYKDALETELFPGRSMVPKTLVFCKDDSHAEDTVHLVREVFGKGDDFAKKITYQAKHAVTGKPAKAEELIKEFRNSPTLRVAITVDMIATGTDIKPLECLLFLRDTRSRNYFEQMKGRGTRTLTPTELQAVSGADADAKTHFVIVDAVGVCESDKSDSRPLDREPGLALDKLVTQVALGARDEDKLTTLAGRLARLERALPADRLAELQKLAGGRSLGEIAAALLRACDPDAIAGKAAGHPEASPAESTPAARDRARADLTLDACRPFDDPDFRAALTRARRDEEQTLDTLSPDTLLYAGRDPAAKERAAALTGSFRDFIEQNREKLDALRILYARPYSLRLTEPMLKALEKSLRDTRAEWTEDRLWAAYAATAPGRVLGRTRPGRFADLVSLVRFALEREAHLRPFADSVRERFASWLDHKQAAGPAFSPEQLAWLELIRDHIATSCAIETDDFDYAPFTQRGGLGRAHRLFGDALPALLDELNAALAA